jgi:hypothetical protein
VPSVADDVVSTDHAAIGRRSSTTMVLCRRVITLGDSDKFKFRIWTALVMMCAGLPSPHFTAPHCAADFFNSGRLRESVSDTNQNGRKCRRGG